MLTHDELIFSIKQEYPDALHGIDFWVLQNTDRETGLQTQDAVIYEWKLPAPEPTADEIKAMVEKHRAGVPAYLAARDARAERDRRLQEADALVYKAMDAGDMEAMRLAGQYRQALRDVTSLPGFPLDFEWPIAPENAGSQA
ncbi:XkdW family protein [Ralstonia sp.]|uniref:XkdW family protein n=1 Tax=Ralstonia sp. TaxID=54061 RepID=UPI0031E22E47